MIYLKFLKFFNKKKSLKNSNIFYYFIVNKFLKFIWDIFIIFFIILLKNYINYKILSNKYKNGCF